MNGGSGDAAIAPSGGARRRRHAGALGAAAGSRLALTPLRRHRVQLAGPRVPAPQSPVVWRLDEPIYYRPEAGGMLVSPCDETPAEPTGMPASDPAVLTGLYERLGRLAPELAEQATVKRMWACLRTMTPIGTSRSARRHSEGAVLVRGMGGAQTAGGRGRAAGAHAGGLAHPLTRGLSPERFG